jgi:hypothetical protein
VFESVLGNVGFVVDKATLWQTFFQSISVSLRLCGLVVRVLGYRSGGRVRFRALPEKKYVVGLERGPLSLVSTTEELLDRKVVAPV